MNVLLRLRMMYSLLHHLPQYMIDKDKFGWQDQKGFTVTTTPFTRTICGLCNKTISADPKSLGRHCDRLSHLEGMEKATGSKFKPALWKMCLYCTYEYVHRGYFYGPSVCSFSGHAGRAKTYSRSTWRCARRDLTTRERLSTTRRSNAPTSGSVPPRTFPSGTPTGGSRQLAGNSSNVLLSRPPATPMILYRGPFHDPCLRLATSFARTITRITSPTMRTKPPTSRSGSAAVPTTRPTRPLPRPPISSPNHQLITMAPLQVGDSFPEGVKFE